MWECGGLAGGPSTPSLLYRNRRWPSSLSLSSTRTFPCGEGVFHPHTLIPSLLHQLLSELSQPGKQQLQIYCTRRFFVFLTRGANKNGWTAFKKLRSLAASMKTVSEENHQHGSFAETKITGCHDSTLLQLGKKAQIIRQKKNFTRLSQP